MTEDDKKLITEWMGMCWHERKSEHAFLKSWDYSICAKCGKSVNFQYFDFPSFSPDDWNTLGLIKEKIAGDGKWKNFYIWARHQFCKDFVTVCSRDDMEANFNCWLIQPINFFPLVAAWLREEGVG